MEGVKTSDFYVTISVAETAECLKMGLNGRLLKAEKLDEYQLALSEGKEICLLVFQKYSFRADDRPILVVLLEGLEGKTKVHLCGAAALSTFFGFDLMEVAKEFVQNAEAALQKYKVE